MQAYHARFNTFRDFLRASEETEGDIAARGEIFQGSGLSAMRVPRVKLNAVTLKKGAHGGEA